MQGAMLLPDRSPELQTAISAVDEHALRVDLAAAFRLAAQFDWHESVGNHFSAAVGTQGRQFLLNPRWRHFSEMRASDLLLLTAGDDACMAGPNAPDPSAWCVHGAIHRALPRARVLLHCHPRYATVLCSLKDPSLKPIDQNTARFFGRVAVDTAFGGMADTMAEGARLVDALGGFDVMLMGNHGVTVIGESVAEAFEQLYFLERAARTLVQAYATGRELNCMPPELAEKTARSWEAYRGMAHAHFAHLKRALDESDPSYKD